MRTILILVIVVPLVAVLGGLGFYVYSTVTASPAAIQQSGTSMAQAGAGTIRTNQPLTPASHYNLIDSLAAKPLPTNKWWSSALSGPWPDTLTNLPFATKLSAQGLQTNDPQVVAAADTFGAAFQPDISLSFGKDQADHAVISAYDDASVTIRSLARGGATLLEAQLIKGSPFEFLTAYQPLSLSFGSVIPESAQLANGRTALYARVSGTSYAVYAPGGTVTAGSGNTYLITPAPAGSRLVIAVLPSDAPSSIRAQFEQYSATPVASVTATFSVESTTVTTHYAWATASNQATLFLLLPNQQTPETLALPRLGSYATIRGTAYLLAGDTLDVSLPQQPYLASLPLPTEDSFFKRDQLETYLRQATTESLTVSDTSYEAGKDLFRIANLLQIAKQANSPTAQKFQQVLTRELTNWYTYTPGETGKYFYYDPTIRGLVAAKPDYGSETFNDHHFHYGYFLYASAVLASYDPSFVTHYAPTVNLLARDIASTDRSDKDYPYLRTFDAYEGHSWADGQAKFADGNDQESSSEAINAWYGLMLWGTASGNQAMVQTGTWLYTEESTAALTYNFKVKSPSSFPTAYVHHQVSLLWGSKADWATWFSSEPAAKLGILYLPLSGGSLYLNTGSNLADGRKALSKELGNKTPTSWQDTLLMANALDQPATSQASFDPAVPVDSSASLAYEYYWLAWAKHRQ